MVVPVLLVGQSLGDNVIEVGVVAKDDVSTDIEEEALLGHIGAGQAAGFLVSIDKEPGGSVLRKKHVLFVSPGSSPIPPPADSTHELVEALGGTETGGTCLREDEALAICGRRAGLQIPRLTSTNDKRVDRGGRRHGFCGGSVGSEGEEREKEREREREGEEECLSAKACLGCIGSEKVLKDEAGWC